MTATTTEHLPRFAGLAPAHGTFPIAANTLILKGTLVAKNASDQAVPPGAGFPIVGVAEATYDNRTGSSNGGAAGAVDVELSYGVFGYLLDGSSATPSPGDVLFAVDNQTVSTDPTGSRGVAGICSEVRADQAGVNRVYFQVGPIASAIAGAAAEGVSIEVPLGNFRLASGAAIPAFASGSADGFTLADSEALCLRINDDSTTVFWAAVKLPESLPSGNPVLHVLASRIGATDTAAALLTCTVFANREGVAYDAGSGLTTGNFAIMAGATKVVQELTKALDQNGGPSAGDVLSISLSAVTANLANDDLAIHAVWLTF
jgi:hypothetical protein